MRLAPPPSTCPVPPLRQQPSVCLTLPVRMMPRFVRHALLAPTPTCMCLPRTLAITKTPSPGLCLSATPRICQSLPAPIRRRSTIPLPENREGTPENRSGALLELLEQFASRGVNLSRIDRAPPAGRWAPICSAWMQTGIFMRPRMRDCPARPAPHSARH